MPAAPDNTGVTVGVVIVLLLFVTGVIVAAVIIGLAFWRRYNIYKCTHTHTYTHVLSNIHTIQLYMNIHTPTLMHIQAIIQSCEQFDYVPVDVAVMNIMHYTL